MIRMRCSYWFLLKSQNQNNSRRRSLWSAKLTKVLLHVIIFLLDKTNSVTRRTKRPITRHLKVSQSTLSHIAHAAMLASGEAGGATIEVLAFDKLRTDTYERMGQEIANRLTANPEPIAQERLMGTYVEVLEPQVRSAVMAMRGKGYNTTASGFNGTDDDWRVMGIDNPARTI